MANRSHLRFKNPIEGVTRHRYSRRSIDTDGNGDNAPLPDYTLKSQDYNISIGRFFDGLAQRERDRNPELVVPETIVCVELTFHGYFNSADFENYYRINFGLSPIRYFNHNTQALFAVVDDVLLDDFIENIRSFIRCEDHLNPDYDRKIKYIQSFKFHSTEEIIDTFKNPNDTSYLSLLHNQELIQNKIPVLREALFNYLGEREIPFNYEEHAEVIDINEINNDTLLEIARNFDIVHSINSTTSVIIRLGTFGTEHRELPFTLAEPSHDLPIVGVLDTGISDQSPLAPLIVNTDNSFSLTGSNPRIDEAYEGYGHGTAVGAFVSLGTQLAGEVSGTLRPYSRLLSIKVLSDSSGVLSDFEVVRLIRKAHDELGVQIFVLTANHDNYLHTATTFSRYAYMLDNLSHELDILIIISTANFNPGPNAAITDAHPQHLLDVSANICSPADSLNNLTVGAVGDNFEAVPITADQYPATDPDLPAIYTRKFHYDYENATLKNSKLIKPDVLFAGGNYTVRPVNSLDNIGPAGLQYLTAHPGVRFEREPGTSFSTALVANIAAQIAGQYPGIRMQSIKALLINSASPINLNSVHPRIAAHQERFLCGHGQPNVERCLFSSENEATIILEDTIRVGDVKSYSIRIPDYLTDEEMQEYYRTVLEFTATLCYRIQPIQHNDLVYCPVNISFGIFRNLVLEDGHMEFRNERRVRVDTGINGNSGENIKVKDSWSQDAIYKSKQLSNAQKVSFRVNKEDILNEDHTFKLSLFCHYHKLLTEIEERSLQDDFEFSLVLRIREHQRSDNLTGRLYADLQAVNTLEAMTELELDADLEV